MKNIMKKSLSVVMIVVLCLTIAPLKGFVGAELIKSKAAYVEETLDEKNTLYQTYYIDKHIEFINSDHYYNMKNYERWAYYLEEAASSTVKDIAAGVHDMLSVADSLINLDFNGIPVASNAYTTVVTSLFTDADTSNIFTEIYEKYIDLESVGFFTKLKKLCQDSGKWSNSINFDVEIQHLWNLNISDYESNSFCVFITDCLETQGVSKMQSMGLFADIEAYSEISGCIGSVSSLIDALVRWGKYEAAIKAFRNTSSEFKIVFSSLNGSGNAWLDNAVNTYLSCLDDEYASDYLKTKIVVDGVLTAINVGNDLFKPFITKGAAKLYGVEASVAAACIFAFDFGFKLSNAITGNDAIVECKRLLRANSELEKRMYTVLTSYENKLLSTNSYNNAKLYDVAYNMYRNVQIFSLNSYSSMLDKQKDTVLNRILCWTKLRDVSDYEHEIKFCAENIALWQSSICHDPDVLITSDYLEINSNHMYTVACPTDVEVADSEGNKLVEIVADKLLHLDERCVAIVVDSIKVIVIPSSIECIIKITGTDQGQMDYTIDEYNEGNIVRSLKYKDVPLEKGSEYIATVPDKIMQSSESYTLEDNNKNPVELYSDSLPPVEDNIVDVIVAEELFDGFSVEIIDLVADAMFNMKSVVDLSAYDISTDDAVALFSAVAKYYPAEYSLISNSDFTYKIIVSPNLDRIMKIRFYYGDDANLSAYQKRVKDLNAEINALVEKVAGMNEFEKALYIHDYIVLNSEYDLELLDYMEKNNFILPGELRSEKYTEYSILVNGTGVCGSYALAYRAILNAAGMECLYLSSSQMNHAWNLVKIDGKWYHVDCCWDDPTPDTYGRARRTYFLRTDDEIMNLNHYSWTPGQYKANSEKYSDMPRNYDIKQKYDDGKWYYLTGSTLYSSDEYGKNETEITSISASSIDADNGNVYYSDGRYIYEYNIETEKTAPVYMLSNKDSGDKPSQAYLSNIYVDGENAEFYKSIYSDDKRITAYGTDILQREKFSAITGIEISDSEVSLDVFETLQLSANIITSGIVEDLEVEWISSDENIVKVDTKGKITAANVGVATITARIFDFVACCEITVTGSGLTGFCGDNAQWSFDPSTCELTLDGTGRLPDYDLNSDNYVPWRNYIGVIESVTIKDGITYLGDFTFGSRYLIYNSLKSVVLADSITETGSCVFESCEKLEAVKLPSKLNKINADVFKGCKSLKTIKLPSTVTEIWSGAFYNCSSLESIEFSDNLLVIGARAFSECSSLKNVIIPNSVKELGESLDTFPISAAYSGGGVFSYCTSLETVTLPTSITSIKGDMFYNNRSLKDIVIPKTVTSIGYDAFYGCSGLTSVSISKNVNSLDDSTFGNCTNLKQITVDSLNSTYATVDGVLYNKEKTKLIIYPAAKDVNVFTVPNSVTTMGDFAFYNNKLNDIQMSDSLTEIGSQSFAYSKNLKEIVIREKVEKIGAKAFVSCSSLESITVDEKNSFFASVEGVLFDKNMRKLIHYPSNKKDVVYSIPEGIQVGSRTLFDDARNLRSLIIPESFTSSLFEANSLLHMFGSTNRNGSIEYLYIKSQNSNLYLDYIDDWRGLVKVYTLTNSGSLQRNAQCIFYSTTDTTAYSTAEYKVDINAEPHEHDYFLFGYEEATETKDGYEIWTCYREDDSYRIPVHYYGEDIIIEPTCVDGGYESKTCLNCGEVEVIETTPATGKHNYKLISTAPGTCITAPVYTYTCSSCGDTYTKEGKIEEGHSYETTVVSPTCDEKGYTKEMCTVCGETLLSDFTSPKGHEFIINKLADYCSAHGTLEYSCKNCDYTESVVSDEADLVTETVTVEPTCTKSGSESEICTLCDATVSVKMLNPLSHEYSDEYTVDVEATCTSSGQKSQHCIRCDAKRAVTVIGATGHQNTGVINDVVSTCSKNGYSGDTFCYDCNSIIANGTSTEKASHTESDWITDRISTCTDEGSKHTECTECGEVIKTESIAKLSHEYASVITKPSCDNEGYTTYTCSNCSDSYISDVIPATGHNYVEGVCTVCGESKVNNCSHICHKSGFMGFIWKILRFFFKLFKIQPVCSCGVAHY